MNSDKSPSSRPSPRRLHGTDIPPFLYGTAWKEDATAGLVRRALEAGFRGIDTANQRKHYHEAAVGEGLAAAVEAGVVGREEVFLQTKFTYREGQDHRLPYDPEAAVEDQVRQSLDSSFAHLGLDPEGDPSTHRLDSLVLHGPRTRRGLSDDDRRVWRTFEALHREGRVGLLGVSNVSAEQLAAFVELAEVPVSFVQNRCFARLGWDRDTRAVAAEHGVVYQGFSLLTANRTELGSEAVGTIAAAHGLTRPQVIFRLALELGMVPLTGTTDDEHMGRDLAVVDGPALAPDEVAALEGLSG